MLPAERIRLLPPAYEAGVWGAVALAAAAEAPAAERRGLSSGDGAPWHGAGAWRVEGWPE